MSNKNEKKIKAPRRERSELKARMKSFIMFIPNMLILLGRLIKDPRVPKTEKALFLAAIVYVISPIDLIPDVFPFIGQVDDVYVVALTLLRLVNRSDADIVRQHWPGGGDVFALAESIANIAPRFMPRRVARVITARLELAPTPNIIRGLAKRDQPIVREVGGGEKRVIESPSAAVS